MEKPAVLRASLADVWRVPRAVWRARRALEAGDLATAHDSIAPLLGRFGSVTFVRKIAAEVLYASGDPLSAASLFEGVAKKLPRDRAAAIGLVASYAALNRAGDARRASALRPDDVDVRLALAWSELVALGGDRERGARLVEALAGEVAHDRSPERAAMLDALRAIAAARRGDRAAALAALRAAQAGSSELRPEDRSFLGYLGGVALRELGAPEDARRTFELAMEAAPETIGAALARRERANLG